MKKIPVARWWRYYSQTWSLSLQNQ